MRADPPIQSVITLDVEGVLTPEIWIALANHFGIEELTRTTKDEPDYQLLMETILGLQPELHQSDWSIVLQTSSCPNKPTLRPLSHLLSFVVVPIARKGQFDALFAVPGQERGAFALPP